MRGTARGPLLALLLAACAGPTGDGAQKANSDKPSRPDEAALAIPTRLLARKGKLVLSSHWRPSIQVTGIQVTRSSPSEWLARGGVQLTLGKLTAEFRDELKVSFLDDHEHLLLHASDVQSIERDVGYTHRHENVQSVTIADDKLSILSR